MAQADAGAAQEGASGQAKVASTKTSPEDSLEILLAEYHHRSNGVQQQYDSILRVASIAYATAVAVATVISSNIMPVEYFHHEHTLSRVLFSTKTGVYSILVVYWLIFSVAAAIYVALIVVSFLGLRDEGSSETQLGLFVAMHGVLALVMTMSVVPVLRGFRDNYIEWRDKPSTRPITEGMRGRYLRFMIYCLLPRPGDFVLKSVNVVVPILICVAFIGESLDRDALFTIVIVFLTIDFLAKQTTYIRNDVLDIGNDQRHPYKRLRGLARLGAEHGTVPAKVVFWLRLALVTGLSVGLWRVLELWWAPLLVLFIFLWQELYDRWAKPKGGFWGLTITAIGYTERWAAGALSVMAGYGIYDLALLVQLLAMGVSFAMVFLASFWWAEADLYLRKASFDGTLADRRHGSKTWFLSRSHPYRRGFTVLLFPWSTLVFSRYLGASLAESKMVILISIGIGLTAVIAWANLLRSLRPGRVRAVWRFALLLVLAFMGFAVYRFDSSFLAQYLAMGGPMFVLVLYEYNPYEDLMLVNLRQDIKNGLAAVDYIVFGSWAITRGVVRTRRWLPMRPKPYRGQWTIQRPPNAQRMPTQSNLGGSALGTSEVKNR